MIEYVVFVNESLKNVGSITNINATIMSEKTWKCRAWIVGKSTNLLSSRQAYLQLTGLPVFQAWHF
jgi:hypothetical protein